MTKVKTLPIPNHKPKTVLLSEEKGVRLVRLKIIKGGKREKCCNLFSRTIYT